MFTSLNNVTSLKLTKDSVGTSFADVCSHVAFIQLNSCCKARDRLACSFEYHQTGYFFSHKQKDDGSIRQLTYDPCCNVAA